ncbi:MAG: c-type cytochrome domain-containing protein [Planctomycetota bacterium]|jgi:hypothetical protein
MLLRSALIFFAPMSLVAQEPVHFESQILPIFQESCFQCHQETYTDEGGRLREPKSGLRLDGAGWIIRGSDYAEVLTPGDPDDSLLYELISLPEDDESRMPAKGTPLADAKVELVKRWIEEGADFGDWKGKKGPKKAHAKVTPKKTLLLQSLAEGASKASPVTIARAEGIVAQITSALPGTALLRVDFAGNREKVGYDEVSALMTLRELIVELDLSRTTVGDRAIGKLARMPRLIKLNLSHTQIGGGALSDVATLPELRVLNLVGTKIGDGDLRRLAKLEKLETLYLWGSKVTESGVKNLQLLLPNCRMVLNTGMPAPEVGAEPQGRRRRR